MIVFESDPLADKEETKKNISSIAGKWPSLSPRNSLWN